MGVPRFPLGAAAVLAMLASSGSAVAAVPDRVAQDDATVVCGRHDRDRALAQMRAAGFSHVRINVIHARGADGVGLVACNRLPATLADYDSAVAAVRAVGLTPQLTLVWPHQDDSAAIASWMGEMAAHFGADVSRFSVLNEPDLSIPASDDCDPQAVQRMVSTGALTLSTRMRLVKRYVRHRGRYVYRVRSGSWKPGRGYRPRRMRLYRWVLRPQAVVETGSDSAQNVLTVRQGCLAIQRGRKYHGIFDAAAPAIRSAAPGAQVLAGETSPVAGVDLFIGQALPLAADGWAHHCYQWDLTPATSTGGFGIGDTARVQSLVGMPLYYTECGYPNPDAEWDQTRWNGLFTHDNLPAAYAQMWQFAKAQGVREMSQYGWCQTPAGQWDTSIMAGAECTESEEYRTVRDVIASWG